MSQITFAEKSSAPDTPASGKAVLYFDSDGKLCWKTEAGVVVTLDVSPASWTPVPADAATAGNTGTTTTAVGRCFQLGPLVFATFNVVDIVTSGLTAGNSFYLQGLPVAAVNVANVAGAGGMFESFVAFAGKMIPRVVAGESAISFRESSTGAASAPILVSDVTSTTADMQGFVLYWAA